MITKKVSKALWVTAGSFFMVLVYVGMVVPGVPWSTPLILATYCFSKSSERLHNWILNHKVFGPFIKSWQNDRVYPTKVKWIMFVCMDLSLVIIWFTTHNIKLLIGVAAFMLFWLIFAWRFPGSLEESKNRKALGKKLGWLK